MFVRIFGWGRRHPKKRDKSTPPSVFIYRGGRADLALFAESGRCGFFGVFVCVFVISRLEKADKRGGMPTGIEKRLQNGPHKPTAREKSRQTGHAGPLPVKKAGSPLPAGKCPTAERRQLKNRAAGWRGGKKSGQPAPRGVEAGGLRQKKSGQKGRISVDIQGTPRQTGGCTAWHNNAFYICKACLEGH